jgi:hypothetical protein
MRTELLHRYKEEWNALRQLTGSWYLGRRRMIGGVYFRTTVG